MRVKSITNRHAAGVRVPTSVGFLHWTESPTKVGTLNIPMTREPRTLKVERLGRVEYAAGLEIQKQTEASVLTGEQTDTLLLLEHPHTLTLGRRATDGGIIAPDEVLKARGVTVFETNRGGKVTY